MYIQQTISLLFFIRKKKMSADRRCPIYTRLTIDGLADEFSTGIKVKPGDWDTALKQVADRSFQQDLQQKASPD